jgi:hypothetical protein
MGADYYSATCIGLKVPKKRIVAEVEEYRNLCGCNPQTKPEDYLGAKYCPVCGRMLRRAVKIHKPLFGMPNDYYNNEARIKGWEVTYDTDAHNFYICIFTTGHVEHEKMSPIPLIAEETLAKFNADMREIGLWDADQFGLWTVTYCDY